MKYNPGHYLAVNQHYDLNEFEFLDEPAVVGINKRYNWRDLEPDSGVYDFSEILHDLDLLKTYDKKLIVFFIDKSFDGSQIMPDYLSEHTIVENKIVVSNRWDSYIVERMLLMADTLASLIDSTDYFEGIAIQESALSLSKEALDMNNYTPEAYRDALILTLNGLSERFTNSRVFWYMNFFPWKQDYLYEVIDNLTYDNPVICGPDILPYRVGLERITYPVYYHYYGKIPLGCSVQWSGYQHHKNDTTINEESLHPEGYIKMEEIYKFGRDSLKLNYIFWQYINYLGGDKNNIYDAMELIRKDPVFNCSIPVDFCHNSVFAPVGATWHYDERFFGFNFGHDVDFIRFKADRDTFIQGRKCSVIEKRHQLGCYFRPSHEYIYSEGDKVFFWDQIAEEFQILYDFGAGKGDFWWIDINTEDYSTDSVKITVDSISNTMINDRSLLTQHVTYELFSENMDPVYEYSSKIVERIGDTAYMFNFFPYVTLACDANWTKGLRCYKDEDIGLYETGIAPSCEYIETGIGEEPEDRRIKIYPNPGKGFYRIESPGNSEYKYTIFDSRGCIIEVGDHNNSFVDITAYPAGIYLLRLTWKNGYYTVERLIKN